MNKVPDWLVKRVQALIGVFSLHNWSISVRADSDETTPHGLQAAGVTRFNARYLNAWISFYPGIADDAEGRHTVLHEVLEVVFAPVTELILEEILPEVDTRKRDVYRAWFITEKERLIQTIARSISDTLPDEEAVNGQA